MFTWCEIIESLAGYFSVPLPDYDPDSRDGYVLSDAADWTRRDYSLEDIANFVDWITNV